MTRLPTFALIGAAKSASTALYDHLRDHPDVWFPKKEIQFFDRDRAWELGPEFYRQQFEGYPGVAAVGDATPAMHVPTVAARMFEVLPDVQLVAIVRDPVDRAWSAWQMQVLKGSEPPGRSFEDALGTDPSYVEGGNYAAHLARFDTRYGLDRTLVLLQEDLRADLQGVLARVCTHIGVPTRTLQSRGDGNHGATPRHRWVASATWGLKSLRDRLDRTPFGHVLRHPTVDNLGRTVRDRIAAWNRSTTPPPKCPEDVRARVLGLWKEDTAALESRLNRSLAAWRN